MANAKDLSNDTETRDPEFRNFPAQYQHRNFRVEEAAEELRLSRAYVYRLLAEGKLRRIKIGRRTLIRGDDLLRFREALG